MNMYPLNWAAADEHVRDLRRVACEERLAASVRSCRESGLTRAARKVTGLTRRSPRE